MSLQKGNLEGKIAALKTAKQTEASEAIVAARGKETRKNKTHASNLTTKRKSAAQQAQLKTRQNGIQFLAQQNAQRAAIAAVQATRYPMPSVGGGLPHRGYDGLPLPFNNGQAANPIQYHQSLQMQQREWGNQAIGFSTATMPTNDEEDRDLFLAWKAAQAAKKKK